MTHSKKGSAHPKQQEMEKYLGISSVDELFGDIPSSVRLKRSLAIPGPLSERDLILHFENILSKNTPMTAFIGGGAKNHYIPALVKEVITKPELLNAYTPYQPEVSQGMLQGLFEYQSLISELVEMDVTNASMYDWPTAAAEALLMAVRLLKKRNKVLITKAICPDRLSVIKNYLDGPEIAYDFVGYNPETGEVDLEDLKDKMNEEIAAFYFETPNIFGIIEQQAKEICSIVHKAGSKAICGVDPISLAILSPPGSFGADIAVGEAQYLGIPISYGGPFVGFFSMNYDRRNIRQMPGRLVGLTKTEGEDERGFVLTLSTREQHIKRERATSNICTNQSILAYGAGVYLGLLGPKGLEGTANYCLTAAHYLANKIDKLKHFEAPIFSSPFFNEFAVRLKKGKMLTVKEKLVDYGYAAGYLVKDCFPELGETVILAVTEMHTMEEIDGFLEALKEIDKTL
jgi:glycine dehydrogenase subunit 1